MPDASDQTLKILVQLGVIGEQDVQAAKQLIEETGNAAGKDLSTSLPEGAEMWAKYKNVLEQTGGSSEHLHGKLTEVRRLLSRMGPEAAEAGHLLHFLFNPVIAGAALAAAAMTAYTKHLAEVEEKYKTLLEYGKKVSDDMREIVAARPSDLEGWMKLTEQMAKLHEKTSDVAADFERINAAQRAMDENTAKNKEGPEKDAAEQATITNELARVKQELELKKNIATTRTGNMDAAQVAANTAAELKEDLRTQIEKLPKAIADADSGIEAARKFKITWDTSQAEIDRNRKALQEYTEQKATAEDQLAKAKAGWKGAVDADQTAAENLRAAIENNTAIHTLTRAMGDLNVKLQVLKDSQTKTNAHNQDEALTNAFRGAAGALDAQSHGQKLTEAQTKQITELETILRGSGVNSQAVLGLLKQHAGDIKWMAAELAVLKKHQANNRPVN